MPHHLPASRILAAIRGHVRRLGTNPYRISRSTGLPLTTVQRLLSVQINLPLRNVEVLLEVLGLEVEVVAHRVPSWLDELEKRSSRAPKAKRRTSVRAS